MRWSRAARIHSTAQRASLYDGGGGGGQNRYARRRSAILLVSSLWSEVLRIRAAQLHRTLVSFFNSKTTADISKWYETFLFLLTHSTPPMRSRPYLRDTLYIHIYTSMLICKDKVLLSCLFTLYKIVSILWLLIAFWYRNVKINKFTNYCYYYWFFYIHIIFILI